MASISKLSGFAYSNNLYETRINEQKVFSNTIFPMSLKISYLDFVYEK